MSAVRSREAAGVAAPCPPSPPVPPAPPADGTPGFITSATSARGVDLGTIPDHPPTVRDIWGPHFPKTDLVAFAASQFAALPPWAGEEGPRFRIVVSPGAFAVESRDLAKAERTWERQESARRAEVEMIAAYITEHGEPPPEPLPSREVTEFSRKSRSRMFRAFCDLDYGPLLDQPGCPAMVTLLSPGEWRTVFPDGKSFKKAVKKFRQRWERAWGPIYGLWKLEFQVRARFGQDSPFGGQAPHFHLFTVVPDGRTGEGKRFREWVSETWAAVVNHPDPGEYRKHLRAGTGVDYAAGLRSSDPRRIAVYFSKHGLYEAKSAQNNVPEEWQAPGKGPGRFWGFWGLERCAKAVEVTPEAATWAARIARRHARAQGVTHAVRAPRTEGGRVRAERAPVPMRETPPPWWERRQVYPEVIGLAGAQLVESRRTKHRKVRRRAGRMKYGRGWISLNDGPGFALDVARFLEMS